MPKQQKTNNPPGSIGSMNVAEKPKSLKESAKKLILFSKEHSKGLIIALILSVLSAVFSLVGPGKLSEITDLITEGLMTGIDVDAVLGIGIFLAVIYVLSLAFGFMQGSLFAGISQKICKKMRTNLTRKLNKLPLSYFDKNAYGDTLSRVTNDVDTIGNSLNQSLSSVVSGAVTLVGSLVLMFLTNSIMAITALVSSLLGFSLMIILIAKSQKYFSKQQVKLGKINGHIEEIYSGHTVIKAYNAENESEEEFVSLNSNLYTSAWKAQFISGLMMPIMSFVSNFAYVAVCVVGAVLAMNGVISFGVIVAFMLYVRLFTQPLSTLAQAANVMQSALAASERVFEVLEEPELSKEEKTKTANEQSKGDVTFQNIVFGYDENKPIIKNFSANIKAGQKIAIVGPTGAGKTTLVNLLMRFYEVNSGSILIDGVNISNITREELHDKFTMVLQESWMFEGSIKENIRYNREDVTDDDIISACKSIGLHHTIKTMSKGYDTMLSNATLSVGEKQLLTIARAMVKKSDLLILDEATSSVDTRTEILIQNAMDKLSKGKTSFIIAHRLSTIKNADVILVMKDGNIIETGNHETLLQQKGLYSKLYLSQFDDVA